VKVKTFKIFNPLKKQVKNKIHDFIKAIVDSDQQHVCFYNDYSGIYSFPFRYSKNISYAYDDGRFYNMCMLFKNDIYLTITAFREMNNAFHWDLIEHFEERSMSEDNPIVQSYILFLLSNLSDSEHFEMAMYNKENVKEIKKKIETLDHFFIRDVPLYHASIPDSSFVISYETEFKDRDGVLITREKKQGLHLIVSSNKHHVYYIENRK
jgi:hypothetical protein